jgi:hypothetical protein
MKKIIMTRILVVSNNLLRLFIRVCSSSREREGGEGIGETIKGEVTQPIGV